MKLLTFAACVLAPVTACAQSSPRATSPARAAGSITPEDVSRRIHVIAHDSMGGRDTPSPGLEKTAAYIASEFRRFGLRPGGDSGTFIQRFAAARRVLDTTTTELRLAGARQGALRLGRDFNVTPFADVPAGAAAGPAIMLVGPPDSTNPLGGQSVAGAWVLVAAQPGRGRAGLVTDLHAVESAVAGGAAGVLLVSSRGDDEWEARVARTLRPEIGLEGAADAQPTPPILELRAAALGRLGLDAAAFRGAARAARTVPGLTLSFTSGYTVLNRVAAPNVVGILEGSDPRLKHEYIVYSAHMDHVGTAGLSGGCTARGADFICNGADDDASGTVTVIETAEAFAQLAPRPQRSLIFLTVSGEEHGLWGSAYFADHPPVPIGSIVANLNSDMVGRNWTDTIVAIGKEHSDLGTTLERVAAAHPELNMRPIDDLWPEERFYFRSDHYNFARKGVPILFFFNGVHQDYHQVTDSPDKIDAEKASRIAKLLFHLGLEIANATERPQWKPESYRQIVGTN